MAKSTESRLMDVQNHQAFESPVALKTYRESNGLMPAERVILEKLKPVIAGKSLLDIGVGAGRTTPYMLELSRDYTAIDYSEGLVGQVKERFGLESAYCCDARDMRRFRDGMFDFVMFSFNGIDCISHQGRLAALAEIHRVLKPSGLFYFSSHNRAHLETRGRVPSEYSPVTLLKRKIWQALLLPRHLRLRRHETRTTEYAVVNDSGLRYSLLLYYISMHSQIAQLQLHGFTVEGVYDTQGDPAKEGDLSAWLYYLARK